MASHQRETQEDEPGSTVLAQQFQKDSEDTIMIIGEPLEVRASLACITVDEAFRELDDRRYVFIPVSILSQFRDEMVERERQRRFGIYPDIRSSESWSILRRS